MFSLAFRTRRYGIEYEYEYHFIEYEYDKSQYSATSKAHGEGLNPVRLRVECSDLHRRALDRDLQSGCLTKLSQ